MFCSWSFLIERTPKPFKPPPAPTLLSFALISWLSGGPSPLPPTCFPSRIQHANLQCGEKKVASQQFVLPPPPSRSVRSPPSPTVLIFSSSSLTQQDCASAWHHSAHLQKNVKTLAEPAQRNGFHMQQTSLAAFPQASGPWAWWEQKTWTR